MNTTLKALSVLLTYPTAELQEAAPEIGLVLAQDPAIPRAVWQQLSNWNYHKLNYPCRLILSIYLSDFCESCNKIQIKNLIL